MTTLYSFESDVQGWSGLSSTAVTRDTGTVRTGTGSLKASKTVVAAGQSFAEAASSTYPNLDTTSLEVYVRIDPTSPAASSFQARIRVMYDAEGPSPWGHVDGTLATVTSGDWTKLEMDLSAVDRPNVYRIEVQVLANNNSAGTLAFFVDDVATGNAAATSSGIASVEVRVDGGAWQTATYNTSTKEFTHGLDVSGLAAGQHTVEARATDNAGNVSTIASRTIWHSPDGMYGAAPVAGQHLVPVVVEGYGS